MKISTIISVHRFNMTENTTGGKKNSTGVNIFTSGREKIRPDENLLTAALAGRSIGDWKMLPQKKDFDLG